MRYLLVSSLVPFALVALACGEKEGAGGDPAPSAEAKAAAESAGAEVEKSVAEATAAVAKVFPDDFGKKPCEVLTPSMVAKVAKVSAEGVTSKEMMGMCLYEWEGGNANIGFIRVRATAEDAKQRWESAHKNMSPEEVKAAFEKIGDAAEKKLEEDAKQGEAKADPKHAKPVLGAMAGGLSGGIQWERVEGLGDAAAFEPTRHENKIMDQTIVSYANKMDVLVANISFSVGYSLDGEAKLYKDEGGALAREVIAGLGL